MGILKNEQKLQCEIKSSTVEDILYKDRLSECRTFQGRLEAPQEEFNMSGPNLELQKILYHKKTPQDNGCH